MDCNCQSYQNLSLEEAAKFLGRIIIAIQRNETVFRIGNKIIEASEKAGLYDKVDIPLELDKEALLDIDSKIENFN